MRRNLIAVAAMLLLIAIFSMVVVDYLPANRELSPLQKEKLYMIDSKHLSKMSGVGYIVHHGEVIFDKGNGMATEDKKNASDLEYGVASLTKQFTAACIMQLDEAGKLEIEDPLSKYFPEYEYGTQMNIRHLMCQRSGIADFQVEMEDGQAMIICYMDDGPGVDIEPTNTSEENRKIIRDYVFSRELLFKPGAEYDYSDSNFLLLAEIVEKASGEEFHDYVRKHIFEPLGMKHSAFIDDNDFDKDVIVQADHSEFEGDYYDYKGVEFGCGDLMTTPQDLYLWYRGFVSGKVVNQDSYRQMTDNYSKEDELGYGFGLMISDVSESKVIYHYGWIPSSYSSMIYIPEYDYFQVLLGNNEKGDPHRMAARMAYHFGEIIGLKLVDID